MKKTKKTPAHEVTFDTGISGEELLRRVREAFPTAQITELPDDTLEITER